VWFAFVQRLWSGCRYAHATSASQCKADVTREAEQPSASADEGFARRPPTVARSLRTAALWPQPPARSANGHFVSDYAPLKRELAASDYRSGGRSRLDRRSAPSEQRKATPYSCTLSTQRGTAGKAGARSALQHAADVLQPIEAIERDLHRTLPTHALFAPARGSTMLPSVLVAVRTRSTPQYRRSACGTWTRGGTGEYPAVPRSTGGGRAGPGLVGVLTG
jgi:hypothetical protein